MVVPSDYIVSTQLQLLLFCCGGCSYCWAVTMSNKCQQMSKFSTNGQTDKPTPRSSSPELKILTKIDSSNFKSLQVSWGFLGILWQMPYAIKCYKVWQYGYQKNRIDQTNWSMNAKTNLDEDILSKIQEIKNAIFSFVIWMKNWGFQRRLFLSI